MTDSTGSTQDFVSPITVTGSVITVDTSSSYHGAVYFKAMSYVSTVFDVDKVSLTVCGDQEITNEDPTNEVFDFVEIGTEESSMASYSLDGIF